MENTNQRTSWTTSNNDNLEINKRLLLLENRILEIEKRYTKVMKLLYDLKKSMNFLDSNDELFLNISKETIKAIENKENLNKEVLVKLANKIKVINMNFGKMRKIMKKLERKLK